MSRHRYTVSFPKATPGDEVTWPNSVQVFLDADTHTPAGVASLHEGVSDGPPTATLFSEAASVAFTCPRTGETLTCTTGSPSQTGGSPSAGGGGASEQSLPLADTAATIDTTTYDNTVSGDGKLTTVVMPASDNDGDSVVLAVAVEGDDFPRWLLLADSTDGLYIGDGSFDPYEAGSSVYTDSDGSLTINAPEGATIALQSQSGQIQVGDHDDNLGNVLSVGAAVRIDGGSGIVSGTGDPSGVWGGNVGDIFIRQDGSEGSVIYRCTTAGPGGDAVWTGIL